VKSEARIPAGRPNRRVLAQVEQGPRMSAL
jgi:hypothetical protein